MVALTCALEFQVGPTYGLFQSEEFSFGKKMFPTKMIRGSLGPSVLVRLVLQFLISKADFLGFVMLLFLICVHLLCFLQKLVREFEMICSFQEVLPMGGLELQPQRN